MENFEVKIVSYTAVEYFPFVIVICISKYDSVVGDSDVFLSLSSSGYMSSMAESNDVLFNVNKSSIYLIVLLNRFACIKFVFISIFVIKQKSFCHQRRTICSHWNPYTLSIYAITYTNINIIYQVFHIRD